MELAILVTVGAALLGAPNAVRVLKILFGRDDDPPQLGQDGSS